MLSGVLFKRTGEKGRQIEPQFVNQYLITDVYTYAKQNKWLSKPVLPSIATLVSPLTPWIVMIMSVMRTIAMVMLSRTPGRRSIKKISVANTSVIYHDGRALATCESGPPLRFALPGLETIGWFNGRKSEREPILDDRSGFGGGGVNSFMREWTTGHPRTDIDTNELITFHTTFAKPYVRYSVVQPSKGEDLKSSIFDYPVGGITTSKMMHDFGVSKKHTTILDLPLSLDPLNHARGLPSLCYDVTQKSRFGVFPRYEPDKVQWFETNPCLIFHTVNSWDETRGADFDTQDVVHLLACRLTSATMVFSAGNLPSPEVKAIPPEYVEEDQCRLYYYSFPLPRNQDEPPHIGHQWALSAISFEFPAVSPTRAMRNAQYVYGCSTSESFTVSLGKASKIDYLVKLDVKRLIARGIAEPPQPIKGCVDSRTLTQILASEDPDDPIKLYAMPPGWYAQEPCFVPRVDAQSEDDGWLLTYVFDESQVDEKGDCREGAQSELWVFDAKNIRDIVARIRLPQRVPYGLHGSWFSEQDITFQKPYENVRTADSQPVQATMVTAIRDAIERWMG